MSGRRKFLSSMGGGILTGVSVTVGRSEGQRSRGPYVFLVGPESDRSDYKVITEYLSDEFEKDVLVDQVTSADELVGRLSAGWADFGETTTEVATKAIESYDGDPDLDIVLNRRRGSHWCHASLLLTREETYIDEVSDLKEHPVEGKAKIAFGPKYSAPASIYPLFMLDCAGVDTGKLPHEATEMEFLVHHYGDRRGGHKAAKKLLEEKVVDAAGVARFALTDVNEDARERLQVLDRLGGWENDDIVDIPNNPIVVSPELSTELREEFVEEFMEAVSSLTPENSESDDAVHLFWFNDVRPTERDVYHKTVGATMRGIGDSFVDLEYDDHDLELESGQPPDDIEFEPDEDEVDKEPEAEETETPTSNDLPGDGGDETDLDTDEKMYRRCEENQGGGE